MIVAIGHTKGGVGKSTITVQLATYLRVIKGIEKVWVIDTDPQKSVSNSFIERNANSKESISCASYTNGKELLQQVTTNKEYWDQILIDIGGRDSNVFRSALMLADVLIIPTIPRSYDLNALNDLYSILEGAWGVGSNVKAKAFLSCADSQGSANNEAIEYLKQFSEMSFIDAPINRRKAIGIASSLGLSVFEFTPKDQKACNEVEVLVKKIYGE